MGVTLLIDDVDDGSALPTAIAIPDGARITIRRHRNGADVTVLPAAPIGGASDAEGSVAPRTLGQHNADAVGAVGAPLDALVERLERLEARVSSKVEER